MTDDSSTSGGASHEHGGHSHGAHTHTYGMALRVSLIVTVLFVVLEALIGYKAHSLALMSDAGHNFTDALSLGLSAYAIWIARKPANSGKTFGYHRVAILTALLNSAALAVISLSILIEAIRALRHPVPIDSPLMLVTAAVALVINSAIVWALHGGAKDSLNIRATYIHMATDVISSLMVLVAAAVIHQTGLYVLDPLVSLVIAVIIFVSCWKIVREATDILLEGSPRGLDVDQMVADVKALPHVEAVHDLHVWTVSDGLNYLSCHIEVDDTKTMDDCGQILRSVNNILLNDYSIVHSTIQIETAGACEGITEADPLYCGGTTPRQVSSITRAA